MGEAARSRSEVRRWLDQVPALLRRRGVTAAYVFGSWARDEGDDFSDVDLLVIAPSQHPFVERFRDYPELLAAPGGVDLIIYTPAEFECERRHNRFVRHVLRHARRIV